MVDYTREQPKELTLPPRLPLVGLPNQRAGSTLQDSRLVNAYVELGQDDVIRVVKRPGLTVLHTMSGYGAGLFGEYSIFYQAGEFPLVTSRLYQNGTQVSTVDGYSSTDSPERFFSFVQAPTGDETSVIFMHNGFVARTWEESTSTLTAVPFADQAVGPLSCSIASGSTAVTTASTAALSAYSTVTGTGMPASVYIESIDSATAFTLSAPATATNATASLSFNTAGIPFRDVVSLVDVRQLADGAAVLNKATYVFTLQSKLAGADPDEPLAWNPLNFLYAYVEQDTPTAIARQLTHLIAFKSTSTEFFRDAGVSPGSPLARNDGLHLDVGCYSGRTVQSVDGNVFWVSSTESGQRSVYVSERLKAREIATPAIRRVLEDLSPAYSISFSVRGHTFYVVTDPTAGVSIVYDLASSLWYYWSALGVSYFPFVAATYTQGQTRLQHATDGKIYVFDFDAVDDAGTPITMDIYPPQYDANSRVSKTLSRMHVVADQERGSTLLVRCNDKDQASEEWTNWRTFDLGQPRPTLENFGSFTKRFFHFRHEARTPCRLTAVELEMQVGLL